jgi:hypothetical protein
MERVEEAEVKVKKGGVKGERSRMRGEKGGIKVE